ncbi:alpha-glucosidase [Leptospira gomenensis]|uniref:Alpha-glucosidase n=1 Tax=Leptospira gomenensis TaxID=2484974 RepID=A0A5F1Y7A1_9LEPT|nr:alpha-glucosidase [Leptospira gomenensis]TGK28946.1 alpha-glucosidase [Leptospira gomenensis]TGK35407.1 alpha-glucosidase [Leptospira gomenensis]TGK40705.1 alpha-glucosidase [Leptospira gomenensis]TGK68451.1 alpha-glucosidase [Leptospira gomenensis]
MSPKKSKKKPDDRLNKWWQKTTIYQIYPRSFADTNGDGIGDILGIIGKLDYLKDLGIETIWVSPFYKSPQRDHGYDVSDYYSISTEYGSLKDAEKLIKEVHKRGMKIVFDMVMNHTSDQHEWFLESRSSRNNPKRDWYIWRDGRGKNKPPNNWSSFVTPKAWQYDEKTDQWFCASFLDFQPDLNYYNPEVKKAMFDVLRFWLKKGVDGFRLDIFHAIYKDRHFRDNPFRFKYIVSENDHDGYFQRRLYTVNHPDNFEFAKEIRAVLNEFDGDRFSVGEVAGDDQIIKRYLGEKRDGLNLIFLFETLLLKFKASFFRGIVKKMEELYPYPYIPTYVFGNHDQRRYMRKINNNLEKGKLVALFQFTARGVPVTYYGEEIGMTNETIKLTEAQDPLARIYRWLGDTLSELLGLADIIIRDRARSPMQWDDSPNAGFTTKNAKPWIRVHGNYKQRNVKTEEEDPDSLLNTYKKVIRLRNKSKALQEGTLSLIEEGVPKDLLVFVREFGDEKKLIVMNFGKKPRVFVNPTDCQKYFLATVPWGQNEFDSFTLPPCSGLILGN